METQDMVEVIAHACSVLGVPGLTETLRIESERLLQVPSKTDSSNPASFRIIGDQLVPAINTAAISALQRDARETPAPEGRF
jgi:hypothetical protein